MLKFSIATPVMNDIKYLPRCIWSVKNQGYTDREQIVQDACSSDGTSEWLAKQDGIDARTEKDDGMYDAINKAWGRSDGDIVSWLNADEQYLPGTLEAVARCFQAKPRVDAVFGDYIAVNESGSPVCARKEIPLRRWYVVNSTLYVMSCTLFVRRRILDSVGGLDESYRMAGDKDWIMRMLDAGVRFHHLPSFLSLFAVRPDNLSIDLASEVKRLRETYGTYRTELGRMVPRACRYAEKVLGGCYGRHHVTYECVVGDGPETTTMDEVVGSKWIDVSESD